MLILSINVNAQEWQLWINRTFEGETTGIYTVSGTGQSIGTTGCRTGNCFIATDTSGATTEMAYVNNATWQWNISKPLKLKYWKQTGASDSLGVPFFFSTSSEWFGYAYRYVNPNSKITMFRDPTTGGVEALDINSTATTSKVNTWIWCETIFNNLTSLNRSTCWTSNTESGIIIRMSNYEQTDVGLYTDKTPLMGFVSNKDYKIDDIEYWIQGETPPPLPADPPDLTLTTDLISGINLTDQPYQFNFTGDVSNTTDLFDCYLYLNSSLNQSLLQKALNQTTYGFNLTYGVEQTAYNINVTCNNTAGVTDSFLRTNIFIDSISPSIDFLNIVNKSSLYIGVNFLLNYSVFCSDPNLYSCNNTLVRLNDTGIRNQTLNTSFVSGISGTNSTLNILRSINLLPVGDYAIIAEASDQHTDKEIKDYKVDKTASSLTFEDVITISGDPLEIKKVDYKKQSDRYEWQFDFDCSDCWNYLVLESKNTLDYIEGSDYDGHFVDFAARKWVDFESDQVTNYNIIKINDSVYKIEFYNTKKTVIFHSIGDLNFNQEILYFNVTNNNFAFQMIVFDEDSPSKQLPATAEVEFNYYIGNLTGTIYNYTAELTGGSLYAFNISTNESTITGDLYIKYTTATGFTHRYLLVNSTFNTTQQTNITVYNFNTTTAISDLKITIRQNSNYQYYPNIIAKLQRRYTAEGVWRTVQMDKSGDFGLVFFNIREENTDYRFIFTDMNNNVLKTTDSMKFVCTDDVCDLTVLLDPYSLTTTTTPVFAYYAYNNATNLLYYNWSDPLGISHVVQISAIQHTVTGDLYICNDTNSVPAGHGSCNLTGRSGTVTFKMLSDGDIVINDVITLISGKIGVLIGAAEGGFWTVVLMITAAMFGLFSPVGAVIAVFITLVAAFYLGIFTPLTATFILIAGVISAFIGMRLRS